MPGDAADTVCTGDGCAWESDARGVTAAPRLYDALYVHSDRLRIQGLHGIVPVHAFFLLLQVSQARVTLRRLAERWEGVMSNPGILQEIRYEQKIDKKTLHCID